MQEKNRNTLIPTHPLSVELSQKITDYLDPQQAINLALASKLTLFKVQHNLTKNKVQYFSTLVAQGKQEAAEQLIKGTGDNPLTVDVQDLLLTPATFTDYSGRTFHSTAYEYAYWAKDTHMRRMLEKNMDEDIKAEMLKRCESIEKNGLIYNQNEKEYCTKHFDLSPLKEALRNYVDGYIDWQITNNWTEMEAALMEIGIAQRDIPVHIINEYCRNDRSFNPMPGFFEDILPREITFFTLTDTFKMVPVDFFNSSGLEVNFTLIRGGQGNGLVIWSVETMRSGAGLAARFDLAAIEQLDKVRTFDLGQSRENLKSVTLELNTRSNLT